MSAVTKMSVTAAPVASFAGARRSSAAVARRSTIAHFQVTLETPEGAQAIECADDTYILDAAEVRETLERIFNRRVATRAASRAASRARERGRIASRDADAAPPNDRAIDAMRVGRVARERAGVARARD
jgi:hypothetical protein|tara:strand:- start:8014 stop:8400 length:387 start_codon:yes stop_codon:yes gene_type:complete